METTKVLAPASRASCGNHLHQIGLAFHMYHTDFDKLPPNRLSDLHATWAMLILPYIEQNNLYAEWNLALIYYDQSDVARLTQNKIEHAWFPGPGAHEWQVWRKHLHDFAPRLFRTKA